MEVPLVQRLGGFFQVTDLPGTLNSENGGSPLSVSSRCRRLCSFSERRCSLPGFKTVSRRSIPIVAEPGLRLPVTFALTNCQTPRAIRRITNPGRLRAKRKDTTIFQARILRRMPRLRWLRLVVVQRSKPNCWSMFRIQELVQTNVRG